jgi:hypothetical protein
MTRVKLISRINQGNYKEGDPIRTIEVNNNFNINLITEYYDYKVQPIFSALFTLRNIWHLINQKYNN